MDARRHLLRNQIYQRLKEDILSSVHKAGDQLSVGQLAEQYQASATPVREALNALNQEGFVEILPRVGYFVSHMTVKDIQDIFEFRLVIESASAEMAALNATEEELLYLEKIPFNYDSGDIESYWQYVKNNREFHYSIALATHNKYLAKTVGMLLDQMQRLVYLGLGPVDYREDIINHHPRVLAALKKRDGGLAKQIMIEGLLITRDSVLEAVMKGSHLPVRPIVLSIT